LGSLEQLEYEMKKKVLFVVGAPLPENYLEEIGAENELLEIVTCSDDRDSIIENLPGSEGLVGCPRHHFGAEMIKIAGNSLRWVHVGGAGCDEFLIPELIDSDITLTNGKIIQGPEVSDHAMGLVLCLSRNIHRSIRGQTVREMPRPIELRRKTMVVVGAGGIGFLVAEKAKAFGMRVLAVTPEYLEMTNSIDHFYPVERLQEALPQADFVVMAAPKTEASYQMMGREEFMLMKRSAYYVSVSRGGCTDTQGLVDALLEGQIAGAGLDVTDPEPLPEDHPLREMENVVITPHIAGPSDHNRARTYELIRQNLIRFGRGKSLYNPVDKRLGY